MRGTGQRREDRGSVLVLATVLILVLVGVAALVMDLSQLRIARQRAQHVCDASAMAAAWYLEPVDEAGRVAVTEAATELAATNNQSGNRKVLQPGRDTEGVGVEFPDVKSVAVEGEVHVEFGFARLLGFNSSRAKASATARLDANSGFEYRFLPLGVTDAQVLNQFPDPVTGNQKLSTPYWDLSTGSIGQISNLFPVVFPNSPYSRSAYQNLLTGTAEPCSLDTDSRVTGITDNVAAATTDSLNSRILEDGWSWSAWRDASDEQRATSQRIVILPVLHRELNGSLSVVGFTGFFVESVVLYTDVRLNRHRADLYGRFVPGIVGTKSVRWLKPYEGTDPMLNPFKSEKNLIYRVRLTR